MTSTKPPATEIALSTGTLWIPDGYRPCGDQADVVIHFHGAPGPIRDRFLLSGKSAVLMTVSFNGLSEVYAKPFRDPALFKQLLDETLLRTGERFVTEPMNVRKLVLSSFSAGYGAIREILRTPEYLSLVTDTIFCDSIYAGYVEGTKEVDPADMDSFSAFADLAAGGEKVMWITHSSESPGSYASTTEAADYLIRRVSAERVQADGVDSPNLRLTSKADLNGFHVRGYAGETDEDHGNHIRAYATWLKQL